MEIIIFGAPGVGKGTQAKILASKLNIAHISTGDILRAAIKNNTELGSKAKAIVESGGLVPDEIVAGMLKEALKEERCKSGFILDGYPRTVNQAIILDQIFAELNKTKIDLIRLNSDDNVMITRITNRMVCSSCGNIAIKSDVTENYVCPVCKSINSYITRKDDNEDVIKNRLRLYHEQTSPVFEYYKDKANIIEIDGMLPIEQVTEGILSRLVVN